MRSRVSSLRSCFYMYRRVAERVAVRHERSGNVTSRDQNSWRGKDQIGAFLKEDV